MWYRPFSLLAPWKNIRILSTTLFGNPVQGYFWRKERKTLLDENRTNQRPQCRSVRPICLQVHPYKLTHAYLEHAQKLAGTSLHKGVVEGIQFSEDKSRVTGVKVKASCAQLSGTILNASCGNTVAQKVKNCQELYIFHLHQRLHKMPKKLSNLELVSL